MTFSILPSSKSLKPSASQGALFGGVGPETPSPAGDQAEKTRLEKTPLRFYFHRGPLHARDTVDAQETASN